MNITKNLGKRLREIRKSRGYNQAQLANMMGIEANTISQIELGEQLPKKENLEKLCKILDVTPKDLFDFGHIKAKEELIHDINNIINDADYTTLQCYHKIITSISEIR